MTHQPRTLVAVATYNEREDLPRLIDEIFHYVPSANLLVVDDNSPDGTGRWCDERKTTEPRLHVVHRSSKQGLGSALLIAMQQAIEKQYEFLVTLDADFSHPPQNIPALLSGMTTSDGQPIDVVIGSRYVPGARIEGWPRLRKLLSRVLNGYTRIWLRLAPHDCSGGFRCYRVATLERANLRQARARGYAFLEELLWLLQRHQARIREMPIVFVNRRHGSSKISVREAWAAFWTIFRLGLRTRFTRH